jgi:hypothetical protein
MEPKKVGRALGIGVRVASNMLRQRVAQAAAAQPAPQPAPVTGGIPPATAGNGRQGAGPGQTTSFNRPGNSKVATTKRGVKAFGQAFLGPFTHAGSILWLEITGLFFALFTLFFVQSIYRVLAAWRQGAEHAHLLLYCALAVVFAWFSASSFLRAYRKSKRGPGGAHRARQ